MLDFIIENYYVILIICILLIFGIIGYIIDTIKSQKMSSNNTDTYIPDEEVFIQNTEKEEKEIEESAENLIEEYNNEKTKEDSND